MTPVVSRRFVRAPAFTAALLGLALAATVACRGVEEEEIPGRAALLTPEPSSASSPAPSPSPSPSPAPAELPPAAEGPAVLTMDGPTEAEPGELLTYRLRYEFLRGKEVGVVIAIPRPVKYVSSRIASGSGFLGGEPDPQLGNIDLRWTLVAPAGVLELTVQVPQDMSSGTFLIAASGPTGSAIPLSERVSSNVVQTTVAAR